MNENHDLCEKSSSIAVLSHANFRDKMDETYGARWNLSVLAVESWSWIPRDEGRVYADEGIDLPLACRDLFLRIFRRPWSKASNGFTVIGCFRAHRKQSCARLPPQPMLCKQRQLLRCSASLFLLTSRSNPWEKYQITAKDVDAILTLPSSLFWTFAPWALCLSLPRISRVLHSQINCEFVPVISFLWA